MWDIRVTGTRVFTLEIDGKPILTFEAQNLREANEICGEEWLQSDLGALTSKGVPLCHGGAKLKARLAQPAEIAAFKHAMERAPASEEMTMAFLVELDGVVVEVVVDPGDTPRGA